MKGKDLNLTTLSQNSPAPDRGQTFARLVGQVWALAEAWPHFVPKR